MFLKKIKQKLWLKRCECLINNLFIICLHTLNWLVMTKKEIGDSVLLNIWVNSTQLNIYIFANITKEQIKPPMYLLNVNHIL